MTDAKYPNALLLDGSRVMAGNILSDVTQTRSIGSATNILQNLYVENLYIYPSHLLKFYSGSIIKLRNWADTVWTNLQLGQLLAETGIYAGTVISFQKGNGAIQTYWSAGYRINFDAYVAGAYRTVAQITTTGFFDIPYGGNINLSDDKFIQIGKDSDGSLPTPDSTYRGKLIRVEGGAGVADVTYQCMKKADDSYAWVQIASG